MMIITARLMKRRKKNNNYRILPVFSLASPPRYANTDDIDIENHVKNYEKDVVIFKFFN